MMALEQRLRKLNIIGERLKHLPTIEISLGFARSAPIEIALITDKKGYQFTNFVFGIYDTEDSISVICSELYKSKSKEQKVDTISIWNISDYEFLKKYKKP